MTDTFISYSRKDIAFAKIIHESLKNNNLETWIDWQDIPPSADWFAEIEEAIEQADSFIFIISESSLASKVCKQEILHAEKNNKRMIPVVINDIDPEKVPASLQSLNWIFFREDDEDYRKAIESLITAISLDQLWVKSHTRVQNRALEWMRHNNEKGFLLYGADLVEAEQWLSQSSGKDPPPTSVQTQYIFSSRAQATRRQRITLSAVMAGFVIAVILGVLAWNQRNIAVDESQMRATAQIMAEQAEATAVQEAYARSTQEAIAVEQKGIAVEQRNVAEARQLAALSLNHLDSELDLALLLSIEGERKDSNYLTQGSMISTLQQDPTLMRQFHGQNIISNLKYSPDGKYFISSGDMNIRFWDPVSGTMTGEAIIGHTKTVYDAAINHAGTLLASASEDGTVKLWDLPSREFKSTFLENTSTNAPKFVQFSADDQYIFSFTEKGDVWVWETGTQETVTPEGGPIDIGNLLNEVLICPDSMNLIIASDKTELWNFRTGEKIRELDGESLSDLKLSPNASKIAGFDDKNKQLLLWDSATLNLTKKLTITSTTTDYQDTEIEFHPTQDWIFLINRDKIENLDLNNTEKLTLIKSFDEPEFRDRKNVLSFSPDGKYYIYGGTSSIINLRNTFVSDNQSDPFYEHPGKGYGLDISQDGKYLAITGSDNGDKPIIQLWDLENFGFLKSISVETYVKQTQFNYDVLFHPDGSIIFSGYDDEIRFYDPETSQRIEKTLSTGDDVQKLSLSRNGKLLAVEHSKNSEENLQLWDLETRRKIAVLEMNEKNHLDGNWSVVSIFSPDNKTLAVGLNAGLIIFWDIETKELIGDPIIVSKDVNQITVLAFSPDGKILASGNDIGEIQLWDTQTRFSIGVPMKTALGDVTSLLFNSEGTTLYSADS